MAYEAADKSCFYVDGTVFFDFCKKSILTGQLASALRPLFEALKAAVGVISLGVRKAYTR